METELRPIEFLERIKAAGEETLNGRDGGSRGELLRVGRVDERQPRPAPCPELNELFRIHNPKRVYSARGDYARAIDYRAHARC